MLVLLLFDKSKLRQDEKSCYTVICRLVLRQEAQQNAGNVGLCASAPTYENRIL